VKQPSLPSAPAPTQVESRGQGRSQAERVAVPAAQQQLSDDRICLKKGVLTRAGAAADRVFQPAPQLPAVGVEERHIAAKRRLGAVQGGTGKRGVRVVVVLLHQQPERDQGVQQDGEPSLGRTEPRGKRCGAQYLIRQRGEEVKAQGGEQDFALPVRAGLAKPLLIPLWPLLRYGGLPEFRRRTAHTHSPCARR